MEAEWGRTVDGKLELDGFVETLHAAATPIGITNIGWEIRRASILRDEITYKFHYSDDRDEVSALYAERIDSAYLVIALFPAETRDPIGVAHVTFDGRRTRLRVESESVRFLERVRERMR